MTKHGKEILTDENAQLEDDFDFDEFYEMMEDMIEQDILDNPRKITGDLTRYLNNVGLMAFGENAFIAYGKGQYQKKPIDFNPLGDTLVKDMSLVVLRPIEMVISSVINTSLNLIGVAILILPALLQHKESQHGLVKSMALAMVGVGVAALATVVPLARMFNLATRLYATASDSKSEVKNKEVANLDQEILSLGAEVQAGDKQAVEKLRKIANNLHKEPSPNLTRTYKEQLPNAPIETATNSLKRT